MVSAECNLSLKVEFVTHCRHYRYSVIPKTKKCLDDIDKFLKENHFDECGIIYCLSRMDCEKVAEKLQVSLSYDHFVLVGGELCAKLVTTLESKQAMPSVRRIGNSYFYFLQDT